MSRLTYPDDWPAKKEAWMRLARRFPREDHIPPSWDILGHLALTVAAHAPSDPLDLGNDRTCDGLYSEPSGQDAVDALQWVGVARRSMDSDELSLIDHAVSCGATWEAVGRALGWYGPTAAADARRHRSRLAKKLGVAGGPV